MNVKKTIIAIAAAATITGGVIVEEGTKSEEPQDTILPGEIVEMRTVNSKVWDTGKTVYDSTANKYRRVYLARSYSGKIHRFDDNDKKFKAFDLRVKKKAFIDAALSDRDYEINSGEWTADFEENKPYNFGYKFNGSSISYKALFDTTDAVDIEANAVNSGIKETIVLRDETAPTSLKWMVSIDGTVKENGDGWDIYNNRNEFAFHITRFTAKDANNDVVRITTVMDSGYIIAVIDAEGAKYPITIDPATTTVNASNDSWQRTSGVAGAYPNYYFAARNDPNGESSFTSSTSPHQVGQECYIIAGLDSTYYVHRMLHQYVLAPSLNIVTISACSTYYYVKYTIYTEDDFLLYQIIGTQTGVPNAGWFNDFLAWSDSGAYIVTSTYLTTPKNTSTMASGNFYYQPYTALGIDSLNACVARSDTHRVVFMSEEDIQENTPLSTDGTTTRRSYLSISTSEDSGEESYLSFTYTVADPTGFICTALDSTRVIVQWDNNIEGETKWYIRNYDTSAIIDSSTNATTDTLTGMLENTKYRLQLEIVGGTADGNVSNVDSCRTWAGVPWLVDVESIQIGGLYGYIKFTIDTTGTANPGTTLIAVQNAADAESSFVMPVTGALDSMRDGTLDSSWVWQTYDQWGGSAGDTIIFPTGGYARFQLFTKNTQ